MHQYFGTNIQTNFKTTNTPNRVKQKNIMKKYSTSEINRNFKIKVFGFVDGKKVNMLVGVSGLLRIVGDVDLAERMIGRAFRSMEDKCECKLRRGVKVTFYVF